MQKSTREGLDDSSISLFPLPMGDHLCRSDMTLQEMDDAEAKITKQRDDLAKERKIFTHACLDLGRQREELEQAKREFEENKRTFRLDKVMSFLSFSPRYGVAHDRNARTIVGWTLGPFLTNTLFLPHILGWRSELWIEHRLLHHRARMRTSPRREWQHRQ